MISDVKQKREESSEAPFSLSSPAFLTNPYPAYEAMRSIHPVCKGTSFKYSGWYVTGYEEAAAILKDTRFENRIPLPQSTKKYEHIKNIQSDMLLFKNQQDHRRLRTIVSKMFNPNALASYHLYIEETVEDLLSQLQGRKSIDIVADVAFPLATLVIAKILGVPSEDRHQFKEWSASLIQTIDFTRSRESLTNGNTQVERLLMYFKRLINKRKQAPQADLISTLLQKEQDGQLTEAELLATCILLVIAGHETTVNLISNSVLCLVNHPEQFVMLKENPQLIESAVEEFLRYESPTQLTARMASESVEVNGVTIQRGEQVYILLGAANRDPKKFNHPDRLDITRTPNPHLAFGYGPHFCLGASLARLETQIAVQAIVQRADYLQLAAPELQWRELIGFRALKELPVNFC